MKKITKTKKKILEALEDKEDVINSFEIKIKGDSGNCRITNEEEEWIKEQITEVLSNRRIDNFEIKIYA